MLSDDAAVPPPHCPGTLSRRARTLALVVAATEPATLRLGKQHRSVGRRAQHISVRVRPGRSTLRLRFVLAAGGRSSTQYVAVPRPIVVVSHRTTSG
jgi:hypothetical protein